MASDRLQLQLLISAAGAQRTAAEIRAIQKAIEATAAESGGITQLARAMGSNYAAAQKFARGLRLTPEAAEAAIARLRELNSVGASSEVRFQTLTAQMGLTVRQFQALDRAARQGGQGQSEGVNLLGQGLGVVAFKLNNIIQLFQTLTAAAKPAYDLLIDSNERLNSQILGSQTNLASTSRIFSGGVEIIDPTEKIQASRPALEAAIKQIEKDTESLVGVTSSQVNELFQVTLQNASSLNKQSKQFPDAISAATSLTKGWAAALNVAGVPLNQANQEINSILKGQIDQNSILAKNLNITNDQVRQWQAQGRLVDELNKKLEPFVAGNALAARSIAGISSNIQDIIERTGRTVGEPLLEPIIEGLDDVYNKLKANEDFFTAYFQMIVEQGIQSSELFATNYKNTFEQLGEVMSEAGIVAGQLFIIVSQGLAATGIALDPIISTLGRLIKLSLEGYKKLNDLILFRQIADNQEALNVLFARSNQLQQVGLDLVIEINRKRKEGLVGLEIRDFKAARNQIIAINQQIEAVKQLVSVTPELADARNGEIKRLEALKKKLDVATGGMIIQSAELVKLGTTFEQLEKKVQAGKRGFLNGGEGNPEVFKKSIVELIKTLEIQASLRRVSLSDAATTLEQVRKDVRVEVELQQQAKDAIVKIYSERVSAIKELLENGVLNQKEGLLELDEIKRLANVKGDLKATAEVRKKAAQEIVAIRKNQNAAELAEIETTKSKIEALQAAQRLGEAEADRQLTGLNRVELTKRLELNRVLRDNATSKTEKRQLLAEQGKIFAEQYKLEGDYQKRSNDRALADFDLQRKRIQGAYDTGLINQKLFNESKLGNDLQQQDVAIKQQSIALSRLSEFDLAGRATILAKIAELISKKEALSSEAFENEKKRILTDYDELSIELEKFNAKKLISESEYLEAKTINQAGRVDREIAILTKQSERLGKADKDGREAIAAQISKLQIQRIKILEDGYAAELALIKDAQAKALELVKQSEELRSIELQKLVNNRSIRQEAAERERNRQNVAKQRAELKQAQDFEAALARTAKAARSPETERGYQQQVREARSRTLAVTLQLLQAEGNELERLRGLALKGIEDETGRRTRAVDLQLSQIARVSRERDRAATDTEANASREVALLEVATKVLERQNSLLVARNGLQKANFDAAASGNDLDLARVNRAIEIKKRLVDLYTIDGTGDVEEKIILMRELADLTQNSGASEYQLVQQKIAIERQNAQLKRENILFQQAADRAALSVEQQKIDLANQRAVIEARIAELKAKQAVLDARSNVDQTELNNRKSIEAANLALAQAKALQPGRERDRAILEAKNKLAIAITEAETNVANSLQGVDLAQQQVDLAVQTTQQAVEQVKSQTSIKDLQTEALKVQQGIVLKQLEAAEAAKKYADELERANAALTQSSTTYSKPLVFQARARGGSVNAGQSYIVGENSPEVFVPGVSGTVLNREQVLKNLGSLGGLNLNVGSSSGVDNQAVVDAVRSLEQTIRSRPPTPIVANFAAADDGQLDKMFAIQRSALRGV